MAAVLVMMVLLPITAWSVDEDIVQKQEVEARLLIRALGRYGPEARVSAILLACGKDGLANSVLPAQFDVAKNALDQMMGGDGWSAQNAAFIQALSNDRRVDLAEGTAARLWAYRLGFRDATRSVEGFVLVCDVGVKAADDLLKARAVGK